MPCDFDTPAAIRYEDSEKHGNLAAIFGRNDVIPLWVADMDFEVAPVITEAIRRRTEYPVYGYSFRTPAFYDAVVRWLGRDGGWQVGRDWIEFSPGVVAGCVMAIRALTAEGDGIVIQPPVYPAFAYSIRDNGRVVVDNPLVEANGRFEIDFEDLDSKLARAKVLLLCSPHNPTGRVFTHDELRRIGELCIRHDAWIISDEIHSDIVFAPHRMTRIAEISPEIAARTITFVSPSKTFNVPGLSTAVAVIPSPSLRRAFACEMAKYHVEQGNVFGNEALIAAYTGGDEWLAEAIGYIKGNMEYVASFIEEHLPSVRAFRTEGTFLMWLDFRGWGMSHSDLAAFLVSQARLGLGDGIRFGAEGEGCMRINLATRRAVLEQAMKQLLDASGCLPAHGVASATRAGRSRRLGLWRMYYAARRLAFSNNSKNCVRLRWPSAPETPVFIFPFSAHAYRRKPRRLNDAARKHGGRSGTKI